MEPTNREPSIWLMPWRWNRWTCAVGGAMVMLPGVYFTTYLSLVRPRGGTLVAGDEFFESVRPEYEFPDHVSLTWRRRLFKVFDPAHQIDRILRPTVWPENVKLYLGQDDADFDIDFDWGSDPISSQPPSHQLPLINPPEPPPMPNRPRIQGPE